MWKSIYCYLTGQHEYGVKCEPGEIFLCCRTCGRRTSGWGVGDRQDRQVAVPARALHPLHPRHRQRTA